jgi:alpha-galactosidase
MAKIVIIGAGSHVFSRHLITDILTWPELRDGTISLMDISQEPLDLIAGFARRLVEQNGFNTTIQSTTRRREALDGADYVFVTIQVGGSKATWADRELPRKYGVDQAVGDTTGVGGVFYGTRHVPVILDICRDMAELCPDAWLLSYTNPMAIICWAVNDYTKIKNVGLCHSVQGTASELAKYIGIPVDELDYWVAGINHMAWFLKLNHHGKDVYPLLKEKFKDPAIYSSEDAHWAGPDVVRAEIYKAFGYFNTESSRHMSEYTPYFRKRPELIDKFLLGESKHFSFAGRVKEKEEQDAELQKMLASNEKFPLKHSGEYGSGIIRALETGIPLRINCNVKNNGLITNLPNGCCVEVPSLVDKEGIHPCYVGNLPAQLAALNITEVNVHELAARGIVEKDKNKIFQAILLDPLTSAALTIDETRKMVDEIFAASQQYLSDYK